MAEKDMLCNSDLASASLDNLGRGKENLRGRGGDDIEKINFADVLKLVDSDASSDTDTEETAAYEERQINRADQKIYNDPDHTGTEETTLAKADLINRVGSKVVNEPDDTGISLISDIASQVEQLMELCQYSQVQRAKSDVTKVMTSYADLIPTTELLPSDTNYKELICLSGTIPVLYKGIVDNIPLAMYIMNNYPESAPVCFVRPTPSMQIRHGKHVDESGRIHLRYLQDWTPSQHDLAGLVQVLTSIFGEELPVVVTKPIPDKTSRHEEDQVDFQREETDDLSSQVQRMMEKCQYAHLQSARSDALEVMSHFGDLKPFTNPFTFKTGLKKELVCLSGIIPMFYKGTVYNIPVSIYLMDNHPTSAPHCFVRPTPSMQTRPGKHVDVNGRVYLPYLSEWNRDQHDLTGLVEVMTSIFGEEPPVVAKSIADRTPRNDRTFQRQETDDLSSQVQRMMQKCQYAHVRSATSDVLEAISQYDDLKPLIEPCTFNTGSKKEHVCICGTIPVFYKGTVYNIPVSIYLLVNHPTSAPLCFVRPTPSMQIRQGKHVDMNGRVYFPYLSEWKRGPHDLTSLVQVMTVVFGEDPPVVTKRK